jgi:hypothetical protein
VIKATTTLSLLRGTRINDFGDEVDDDSGAAIVSAVPGSLVEVSRRILDPVSGVWVEVSEMVARFTPGTFPAVAGDRVRDETTAALYWVRRVKATPRSIGGLGALRLRMSRTRPE